MMKHLIMTSFMFALTLVFVGYMQYGEVAIAPNEDNYDEHGRQLAVSEVVDQLEFSTLEEFWDSYRTVKAGRATGDLARLAKSVDFLGIEILHLPIGIPEGYQLFDLTVSENFVHFWYLPKEYLVSEDAKWLAIAQQKDFLISYLRPEDESLMYTLMNRHGRTQEDLIDGKYLHTGRNSFAWSIGGRIFTMEVPLSYVPQRTQETNDFARISEFSSYDELIVFTETTALNLRNDAEVTALIRELEQR